MKTLTFYGSSDDNFCWAIDGKGDDEVGCYDDIAVIQVSSESEDRGLLVVGEYAPGDTASCWSVGLSQLDEDALLPDWPVRFTAEGYSVRLHIEVPDDYEVKIVRPKAGGK